MGTTRKLPDSDIARRNAMNTALGKMTGLTDPADNLLSPETTARLIIAAPKYNNGFANITITSVAYHRAVEQARPQRKLLRAYVKSYFASLKANIKIAKILKAERGYYGLDVTNMRQPDTSTDYLLLTVAESVISGDAARMLAGGIVMSVPTMEEFMDIYTIAKPKIDAISNATTDATTALTKLSDQQEDVDDLIVHIWDDVEGKYSKLKPAERRVQCRLWGVRYISKGMESEVKGICTDSATKLALPNVLLRIAGVGSKTKSDAEGKYAKNTTLYGDLELMASLPGYAPQTIDFAKENGVVKVVDVVMEKEGG